MDNALAGVIITAVVSGSALIIAAMVQFGPRRKGSSNGSDDSSTEHCDTDSRVAVLEANYVNLGRSVDRLREDCKEGFHRIDKDFDDLKKMLGGSRSGGHGGT